VNAPAVPRAAATVVVLREAEAAFGEPFELLLLRREAGASFVAGAHVFPGGQVDEDDSLLAEGRGSEPAARVAAVRELVEEAGVLLARADRRWATAAEAEAVRDGLAAGASFASLLGERGLRPALEAVVPLAHIVTPASEPRRFDTRFFAAELPAGQLARHDGSEMDELVWLAPRRALEQALAGEVALLPPTWMAILRLMPFASLADALAWAVARPIERAEPHTGRDGETRTVTFPGPPLLAGLPGGEPPPLVCFALEPGRPWRPLTDLGRR